MNHERIIQLYIVAMTGLVLISGLVIWWATSR
jgi:hypothetical protein